MDCNRHATLRTFVGFHPAIGKVGTPAAATNGQDGAIARFSGGAESPGGKASSALCLTTRHAAKQSHRSNIIRRRAGRSGSLIG